MYDFGGFMPHAQETFAICDPKMPNFRPYFSLNVQVYTVNQSIIISTLKLTRFE